MRVKAIVIALLLQAGAWGLWSPQDTILIFAGSNNPDSNQTIQLTNDSAFSVALDSVYVEWIQGQFSSCSCSEPSVIRFCVSQQGVTTSYANTSAHPYPNRSAAFESTIRSSLTGARLTIQAKDTVLLTNIRVTGPTPLAKRQAGADPWFLVRIILTSDRSDRISLLALGRDSVFTYAHAREASELGVFRQSRRAMMFTANGARLSIRHLPALDVCSASGKTAKWISLKQEDKKNGL